MREIAATFEAAGLPPGFHEAAAAVYERPVKRRSRRGPGGPRRLQHTHRYGVVVDNVKVSVLL